jgi:signal transduction histidine kinase
MKQNNFNGAIKTYKTIIEEYQESSTSSGIPLPVTVRLQLVECYTKSGIKDQALKETLNAFEELNRNFYNLNENQYSAYVDIVREKFYNLNSDDQHTGSSIPDYYNEFEKLNSKYQALLANWHIVNSLKNECIPEISRELTQYGGVTDNSLRYSRRIGSEDFLILAMLIPGDVRSESEGIAGIKINNAFLEKNLLNDILITIKPDKDTHLTLSDQEGSIIAGDSIFYNKSTNIVSYFDNNFPPWKIEVPGELTRPLAFSGLYKSFYFWSIMAMMIILVFGVVITGRTIAHEKEILQLKSDFVSSVSHEFKTPITSIKALTERLIDGSVKDPKRVREYYSVISRDAENLSRLVGNILDFSKIEEGKKEYDFEETDFNEWLRQTVLDFSDKIKNERIIFHSAGNEQPLVALIDRASMKLAIDNLLDNAVKFSPGDSEVKVILEKQQKNLMVMIKDHGTGIPEDEQEKIFDKFYRGKDSAAYSAPGTGLGLTIVKQVVEAHRGEIRVQSEIGKGSIFSVILPIIGIV